MARPSRIQSATEDVVCEPPTSGVQYPVAADDTDLRHKTGDRRGDSIGSAIMFVFDAEPVRPGEYLCAAI